MRTFLASSLTALLLIPQIGYGQVDSERGSLDFARALVLEGEYYRAITEFKRVLYFTNPEDTLQQAQALLGIGEALYLGFEYGRAGEWTYVHLDELSQMGRAREASLLLCRSFLKADEGYRLLNIIDENRLTEFETPYYYSLALANTGRWEEAYAGLESLPAENPFKSAAVTQEGIARQAIDASWKSPARAGWLGLVPGLGYSYAGHNQTAVASFVVNVIFWWATYEAFAADQNVLGGFLAVFSFSWYASNIYGSVQAARRYNQRLQLKLWAQFEY